MDYKRLMEIRDGFKGLSSEHLYRSGFDTDEKEKYRHLGKGQAYKVAAEIIDEFIKNNTLPEE